MSTRGRWTWSTCRSRSEARSGTSAEEEIRRRIRERGRITFAEFMQVALFWPGGGYYTSQRRIGAPGDFYTSPHVHPAFGALLAVQLFQLWELLGRPSPFTVAEQGAGDGLLCRDLVSYSSNFPSEFGKALHYLCLDRTFGPGLERDLPSARGLPALARIAAVNVPLRRITGCLLSNEFLDCFPVHQVTVCQGSLREVYVTLRDEQLVKTLGEPSSGDLAARFSDLGVELVEGQTAEINLGIAAWAEQISSALEAGLVLSIDYGHPAAELYSSQRHRGTLTTFYQHTQTDAPYQRIGRQDITAQVDFTSVVNAGRQVGLEPLGFTRQGQFLSNLGLGHFQGRLPDLGLSSRELQANRVGMLDLVRAGGLGDFGVLAQGKNVGQPALWGFEGSEDAGSLVSQLPIALLTSQHLPLLEGRYPHTALEFELENMTPA